MKFYSFEMSLRFTLSSKSLLIELIDHSAGLHLPVQAPGPLGCHAASELPIHLNEAPNKSLTKGGCFTDLKGNGSDK